MVYPLQQDQLKSHENKCKELEQELATHRENSPDSSAKSTVTKDHKLKTDYLEYEVSFRWLGFLSPLSFDRKVGTISWCCNCRTACGSFYKGSLCDSTESVPKIKTSKI